MNQGWAKISLSFRIFLHENDTKIKFQKILCKYSKNTHTGSTGSLKHHLHQKFYQTGAFIYKKPQKPK